MIRLYLGTRLLTPADVDGDVPADVPSAERLLRALLAGADPGTRGRVDVLRYPEREGGRAYAAAIRLVATADGTVQPWLSCDGPSCPCDAPAPSDSADPPVILATAGE